MPTPAFNVCFFFLFFKLNMQCNVFVCFVCVTQAQTGETDVPAEVNMKAAITATEHVHSAQPEKVRA